MRLPCEEAVKKIIPTIRALTAYILIKEYGLSIYSAAKLMGITPAAVSNYVSGRRGKKYQEIIESKPKIKEIIRNIANKLVKGATMEEVIKEVCHACAVLRGVEEICPPDHLE